MAFLKAISEENLFFHFFINLKINAKTKINSA